MRALIVGNVGDRAGFDLGALAKDITSWRGCQPTLQRELSLTEFGVKLLTLHIMLVKTWARDEAAIGLD